MVDKEQQIEDMKKLMIKQHIGIRTALEDSYQTRYAKALYDAGYRKVDKNELIIRKDGITKQEEDIEFFVKHNAEVRKKTAKEILQDLFDKAVNKGFGGSLLPQDLEKIAREQYGVEIKYDEQ